MHGCLYLEAPFQTGYRCETYFVDEFQLFEVWLVDSKSFLV